MFFQKVTDQGGYDGCVSKKAWKSVYDELGVAYVVPTMVSLMALFSPFSHDSTA